VRRREGVNNVRTVRQQDRCRQCRPNAELGIFYLLSIGIGAAARVNRCGGDRPAMTRLSSAASLIGMNRTASGIMQMPREN